MYRTFAISALLLFISCDDYIAQEREYVCESAGYDNCPMQLCCADSDGAGYSNDCYLEAINKEHECPDNDDRSCTEGVCQALTDCYGEVTPECSN